MLEAVISFPPTEHLNKRILNSDGNVSIQMSGKTNNSENKLIQKRKHKNLLIFFQQNYCVPALCNMLYIHHLYIGCIVNWVTCYFWKKILACITVLLWTNLGGLFALLFMFLLLFFPDGNVDLTMQTVTGWLWLGWTELIAFLLVAWQVCNLRTMTFCFITNAVHGPVVLQCFSAIMPEFILCPAGTKIK